MKVKTLIINEKISDTKIKIIVGNVLEMLDVYKHLDEDDCEVEMVEYLDTLGLTGAFDEVRDSDGCGYLVWLNEPLCKKKGKSLEEVLVHELTHVKQRIFSDILELKSGKTSLDELEARFIGALYREASKILKEGFTPDEIR